MAKREIEDLIWVPVFFCMCILLEDALQSVSTMDEKKTPIQFQLMAKAVLPTPQSQLSMI